MKRVEELLREGWAVLRVEALAGRGTAGTVGEAGKRAAEGLAEKESEEAAREAGREAALLLARALGWTKEQLWARTRETVEDEREKYYHELLADRKRGKPVAYLLGQKEFFGRNYYVGEGVLVPRPETEILVQAVLDYFCGLSPPPASPPRILDWGTGSGCIALTLAAAEPTWKILALEASAAALQYATRNCQRHGLEQQVGILLSQGWEGVREEDRFAAVVSNPPYVLEGEEVGKEVRFEPEQAWKGYGPDGLQAYHDLLQGAARHLAPGGRLFWEMGRGQTGLLSFLAREAGWEVEQTYPDLAKIDRVMRLRRAQPAVAEQEIIS